MSAMCHPVSAMEAATTRPRRPAGVRTTEARWEEALRPGFPLLSGRSDVEKHRKRVFSREPQ